MESLVGFLLCSASVKSGGRGHVRPWVASLGALVVGLGFAGTASADAGPQVVVPKPQPMKRVAAVVDLGFIPFGKIGGRLEVALTPMHALYVEPSYIVRHIPSLDRSVSATEVDIGWHLFPKAQGIDGFYVGARGIFAAAAVEEAHAQAWGVGADLGYQWVLSFGPTFNLGAGIGYYHVTAQARPAAISVFWLLDPTYRDTISSATIHASGLMPLGMAGMGLAY